MIKRYSSRWFRLIERNKAYGNNVYFLKNKIEYVDYKNVEMLKNFINKQGNIIPGVFNRLTLKCQKRVAKAIKRARQMALIPYSIVDQNEWTSYSYQQRNNRDNQVRETNTAPNTAPSDK